MNEELKAHSPWDGRRLLAAFGLCLALWGCATASRVKVTAEVVDPVQARSRSVAVVSDSFMDDPIEADNIANLVRDQLVSQGFKVSETEDAAELIVIPTIQRSTQAGAAAVPARMPRPFDIPHGPGQTSLMESQNALRSLGFEFATLPTQEQPRVGLMVTAISREIWLNALLQPQPEIPRIWRIVAITTLRKQDVTPNLVEAVGAKLSEITAPPATPTQRPPQPAPSHPQPTPTQTQSPSARTQSPTPAPSASPKKRR